MRTFPSALLLAAAVAIAAFVAPAGPATAVPASTVATDEAAACADNAECWRGQYTKSGKKPIKAECCEQMEGSILCTKIGDDDALVEFGPGDCRPSQNRKSIKCEKGTHKFNGTR